MNAPPGLAPTIQPRVEQISAESDTDLSTRTKQMRFLVAKLGVTRPEAHRLIVAYERDRERPLVTAGKTYRPGFLAWLMRQAPGPGYQRPAARQGRDYRPRDDRGHLLRATP